MAVWSSLAICVAVFLVISVAVCIVCLLMGAVSVAKRRPQPADNEEARIMQEIYQGLARMESRVDALETIILEKEEERSTP